MMKIFTYIPFNFTSLTKLNFLKLSELKIPSKVIILDKDLEYQYVRGSGPGGQATNKTSNCVLLKHVPTNIIVKCHDTRSLETNKQLAFKRLKDKLDAMINGKLSKENLKAEKRKKQKERRARRSQEKYVKNEEKSDLSSEDEDEKR
jgi:protein subunit release factor B